MKFCATFTLLLALASLKLSGQNLVPNPSFEDTVQCPTTQDQLNYAVGWQNPTGNTPDYFNSCFDNQMTGAPVDVPVNMWGTQNARTGNGYAGFASLYFCSSNCREYIEAALLDTLLAGKKYCVSYYVSLSDSSTVGIDRIGAYFSDTMVLDITTIEYLPFTPQVESVHGVPIIDTVGWVEVRDTFIAQGGEKWLIIGSFCTDSEYVRDTIRTASYIGSYYYIDDVSVYLCDDTSVPTPPAFPEITLGPNPNGGTMTLTGNFGFDTRVEFFDAAGRLVQWENVAQGNTQQTIYVPQLAEGLYLYRVISGAQELKRGKVVVSK